ncbi:MAG: hypothetical protein JSW00_10870 [Thermoplasmata archaeon]|nr:MAG: hypothetical protein JSW00_10870 [Thermoplasmata archaeon]
MANLIEILKKIIQSYEFNITEEHPNYILGSKEGSNIACAVLPAREKITSSDIMALKEELPQDMDKIIIATTVDIDPELEELATSEQVLLWDKKKLEEEIGRAVLADMEGEFSPEISLSPVEPEKEEPVLDEGPPEIEVVSSDVEPMEVKIVPKQAEMAKEVIMKPQISMSEVSEISKKIIQGFRFDLELIPYYVFDYSCELVVEGEQTPSLSSGTLAVNGLTNNAESWDFAFETLEDLETTHTKLEPKFDEKKAFETARESAISLNTKEIQTVDDRGAVTIYEKKKVRPKEDAIDILQRGLIYLPVWCVEGSNGVMIINATTGKIIKEDIYRESDDIYPRSSSSSYSL